MVQTLETLLNTGFGGGTPQKNNWYKTQKTMVQKIGVKNSLGVKICAISF